MPDANRRPTIHVIATQHLDVAYLWRRHPDGHALMRRCFERAVEMLDADPEGEFLFSRSTAWSFDVLEREDPALFERVRAYVARGRIELCGGQWVEPDNLLPDGETLVRQSLYGQGYFQERFGRRARVSWNPDAFSHGNTLPQIFRLSGLDGYYFHRCQPRDREGHEITQFVWEGLDGSRVYVLAGNWVGRPDAEVLRRGARELARTGLPMAFVATGANSDRRVTMEVDWLETLREAVETPGLPPARWATASEALDEVRACAGQLPLIRGELGFQFTGTYTSEGNIKRALRRSEALLADAEKLSTVAALLGAPALPLPVAHRALADAWRDLCVNAFHDIACGTCYQHVHEEALALFDDIEARGTRLRDDALRAIASLVDTTPPGGGRPLLVVNTLSWPRRGPVVLPPPVEGPVEVRDDRGAPLPAQAITLPDGSRGVAFVPPAEVPALSYHHFSLHRAPGADPRDAVGANPRVRPTPEGGHAGPPNRLENAFLRVEVDPGTGELIRLVDQARGRDLLAPGGRGNRLAFYGDRCSLAAYEPWTIGYTGQVYPGGQATAVERVEAGPVRSAIRVERRVQLAPDLPPTELIQEIVLYDDLPLLLFQTRGNWQARRVLLKAEFDLGFEIERLACEVPYGAVERAPHMGQAATQISQGAAQEDGLPAGTTVQEPDRPMQRWLDVSDAKGGLAFLNDGKYGYDASPRQVRISLMRAPVHRDGELVGLGPFAFCYALLPHAGGWQGARLPREGYAFNHALLPCLPDPHPGRDLAGRSVYRVEGEGALITAIKRAERSEATVLRLVESQGRPVTARVVSAFEMVGATCCDLLEEPLPAGADACRRAGPRAVEVSLRPFEIKTLLVRHR